MVSHFDNLVSHIPNLASLKMLDLGSGRGKFLMQAGKAGADIIGIEPWNQYRELSRANIEKENLKIKVIDGSAENIPFEDNSFDFINVSEVIEHVDNANSAISEVYRVLRKNGNAYMSVPSRFGIKDPHVHLYFVNWLPRSWSELFISIFSKPRDYDTMSEGRHRLKDMNYYRFNEIKKKLNNIGFEVIDIRENKIKKKFANKFIVFLCLMLYKIIRPFYFDTFHFLLKK